MGAGLQPGVVLKFASLRLSLPKSRDEAKGWACASSNFAGIPVAVSETPSPRKKTYVERHRTDGTFSELIVFSTL